MPHTGIAYQPHILAQIAAPRDFGLAAREWDQLIIDTVGDQQRDGDRAGGAVLCDQPLNGRVGQHIDRQEIIRRGQIAQQQEGGGRGETGARDAVEAGALVALNE